MIAIDVRSSSSDENMTGYVTNKRKLAVCFLGVFISYFYYGVVQEKITRADYGEKKEKFVYALSLVFIQCIVNALFAIAGKFMVWVAFLSHLGY
ncbi:Solute carrier family 35 member B1 [Acropora cervicornis]|uniref:Solute carrier family 35 member B1 n=1 Tax=Acropora cervicornis TaxID=6130 RepID=A0AAD9QP08_ACRCE|nr:Solute carrier family 35 member B1 [Acropora cervicornis]